MTFKRLDGTTVSFSREVLPRELSANGSVTLTVPLQVTVSLGEPMIIQPQGLATGAGAALRPVELRPAELPEAVAQFSIEALASTEFRWSAALSLALASKLAYSPPALVESTCQSWGLATCSFIEAAETQCFVASTPAVALLSFRGTESVGDWLADLNMAHTRRPYGVVHRGFYHAFVDVQVQIEQALRALPGRRLIVTGHSLGGAVATIAAAEWLNTGAFDVASVYTYGQPRVGSSAWQQLLDSKLGDRFARFVNDDDIVPRVPPGFAHAGKLYHFDADGDLENPLEATLPTSARRVVESIAGTSEPPPLTPAQFDQLRAELLAARSAARMEGIEGAMIATPQLEGFFPSIPDHFLDNYIRKILLHVD
jgi:pimeloyl-ACP methyl ester carboxylesterase